MAKKKRCPPPACPYCSTISELVDGSAIYPHRTDLAPKNFYRCPKCVDAYVGCHPGTTIPMGRLADKPLRIAKGAAHDAFDRLWKAKMRRDRCRKREARSAAYAWLADQLGTGPDNTHIGMFDVTLCRRVVDVCAPYLRGW